ncbi:protein-export chaperone SecB [Desulfovibrio sp. JC022]|uniref:protein-export chaperone SecB n=1 Tax=Desulfovibrio sp. JC022 TaxID=2593642 RepID=UPI0013CFE151|nr:protein-export chaperone SecB [Desulfovibrio sp. JC022]NDV21689.1 hypothetical protein [Desulfovibrio sp. JC022]
MKILDIRCLHFCFSVKPINKDIKTALKTDISFSTQYNEEQKTCTVIMDVTSDNTEESPILLQISYGGTFDLEDITPEHPEYKRITSVDLPATIFPYIREHIQDTARRSKIERIDMPFVNFADANK